VGTTERPAWSPYVVYRWTAAELQAWFTANGTCRHYDGRHWKPVVKEVASDLYDVRFEPCD